MCRACSGPEGCDRVSGAKAISILPGRTGQARPHLFGIDGCTKMAGYRWSFLGVPLYAGDAGQRKIRLDSSIRDQLWCPLAWCVEWWHLPDNAMEIIALIESTILSIVGQSLDKFVIFQTLIASCRCRKSI